MSAMLPWRKLLRALTQTICYDIERASKVESSALKSDRIETSAMT